MLVSAFAIASFIKRLTFPQRAVPGTVKIRLGETSLSVRMVPYVPGVNDPSELTLSPASLRWYRLAFSCTTLSSQQPWQTSGDPFLRSIDWASQIILNLSSSAAGPLRTELNQDGHFQPNPDLINFLTFAIDQHFVVMWVHRAHDA